MLTSWNKRPIEVAHLLNPAFCSIILREFVLGYNQECGNSMPYSLSFLVLPLVLHKPTRDLLPRTIATKFHSWVHQNQVMRLDLHNRAKQLVPFSKEALYWCASSGMLAFDEQGGLDVSKHNFKNINWLLDSDPEVCKKKAHFLGRWLTRAGDPATIFAIMGIKP